MSEWSFYHRETGALSSRIAHCRRDRLDCITPPDHLPIEGRLDHRTQRVDVLTLEVITDREAPPAIDPVSSAKAAIAHQEALSLRAIRELLLDPNNHAARARLQQSDDAIAAARPRLNKVTR